MGLMMVMMMMNLLACWMMTVRKITGILCMVIFILLADEVSTG
jgi:hypothetical protein